MRAARIVAAAALVGAFTAGCTTPWKQSSRPAAPVDVSVVKVTLSYQPSGTAALRWDRQSQNVTAKLQMGGFTPGTTYAVDIRKGGCAAAGDVAVPFPTVTADGAGTISTTLTGERLAPGGLLPGTALSVHLDGAPLACGDITAAEVAATLTMAPVGPRPEGWANVTYNPGNKTLVVATWVSGLAPGSASAQQIGLGTCEARGPIKYPMNELIASANGTAYQTAVIQDVDSGPPSSGGWYLNVDSSSPIACGDIGKATTTS